MELRAQIISSKIGYFILVGAQHVHHGVLVKFRLFPSGTFCSWLAVSAISTGRSHGSRFTGAPGRTSIAGEQHRRDTYGKASTKYGGRDRHQQHRAQRDQAVERERTIRFGLIDHRAIMTGPESGEEKPSVPGPVLVTRTRALGLQGRLAPLMALPASGTRALGNAGTRQSQLPLGRVHRVVGVEWPYARRIVLPSETTCGQDWLSNFHPIDLPVAQALVDSLRFVTLSTLSSALKQLLERLVAEGAITPPVLVLPERGLKNFGISKNEEASAVAWRDFAPGDPLSVTPGSDGLVGMVYRDYARAGDGRSAVNGPWIAPDASIDDLRIACCRSIVLLTDFVGTGEQIDTLAGAVARHSTITSWRSLHLIDVHVATFAAQPSGIARLAESRAVDLVHSIEVGPTFETAFPDRIVREAVADLCRTECRIKRQWALGYGGSGGLFVTERNAPNNTPAILWQETESWKPLFPRRTVPPRFAVELGEYRTGESLEELATSVGQLRIGRNERLASMRKSSRDLLQALVSTSRSPVAVSTLSARIGIDQASATALLKALRNLGFIDDADRITDEGRAELDAHKRGLRRTTAGLRGSRDVYYPRSLR